MKGGDSRCLADRAVVAGRRAGVAGTLYRCDTADGAPQLRQQARPGRASARVISLRDQSLATAPAAPRAAAVGSATTPSSVAGSPISAQHRFDRSPVGAAPRRARRTGAEARTRRRASCRGRSTRTSRTACAITRSKAPKGVAGATSLRTIKLQLHGDLLRLRRQAGRQFRHAPPQHRRLSAEIRAAAQQYGVDEAIVRAIIHAESAYNPNALSRVGAQGLMQLMPATARRFGVGNAFDAGQNIRGGVQYLAWLLKRFNGDLTLAAAGYNAGEGAVDKYSGVPPYSETQRYVERVGVLADRYRGAIASSALATK